MGQPSIGPFLLAQHETHKAAGWPISSALWTTTHYMLYDACETEIARRRKNVKTHRADNPGFDAALAKAMRHG